MYYIKQKTIKRNVCSMETKIHRIYNVSHFYPLPNEKDYFFSSLNKNYERKMTQCSGCHYDDSKQRTQISTQRQWLVRL